MFSGELKLPCLLWRCLTLRKNYDFSEDDVQKVVSLCVDGKESRIIFIDHKHVEMSVSKIKVYIYVPCFLSCNFIAPIIPQIHCKINLFTQVNVILV